MESKELARLKDIDGRLKGIEVQLRGQNKILKELVDQIMKIADIFDKQWHGDATATINGDGITVAPYCGPVPPIVKAVDIDTAFAKLKKGIEEAADEMKQEEQNELQ